MPAIPSGEAVARSGGEYRYVQMCVGKPKCVFSEEARKWTQSQKGGCGMCRQEYVFVGDGEQMMEICAVVPGAGVPGAGVDAVPRLPDTGPCMEFGELKFWPLTRRVLRKGAEIFCSPAEAKMLSFFLKPPVSMILGQDLRRDCEMSSMVAFRQHLVRFRKKLRAVGCEIIFDVDSYGFREIGGERPAAPMLDVNKHSWNDGLRHALLAALRYENLTVRELKLMLPDYTLGAIKNELTKLSMARVAKSIRRGRWALRANVMKGRKVA